LIKQARFLAPATEHFLREAGIMSGMRVLDIGCGMGDVSVLVAQLVGPGGRVVSVDLDQASIETAKKRASGGRVRQHDVSSSRYLDLYGW
jgi:ubiquinone/menaquinone biosynthesis C-methylase UbiE